MSFESDINYGSIGERIAWDLLIKDKTTRSVVDVRDDTRFRTKDVDFLWERTDRCFYWVEVKADRMAHETGNIAYELTTSGNIGCLAKTEADFVLYYVAGGGRMLCIDVKPLRRFVAGSSFNEVRMGDRSTGYLIPISTIKRLCDANGRRIVPKEWSIAEQENK